MNKFVCVTQYQASGRIDRVWVQDNEPVTKEGELEYPLNMGGYYIPVTEDRLGDEQEFEIHQQFHWKGDEWNCKYCNEAPK
jgi:hypothetical protein